MTCAKCELIQDKGDMIYEDPEVAVIIPRDAAVKGHVRVYTKKHEESLDALNHDEAGHLFKVASVVAAALFDELSAHGTNIIVNEGVLFQEHIHVDIISRNEGDGLNFRWDPKEFSQSDMDDAFASIKGKADLIGVSGADENEGISDRSDPTKINSGKDSVLAKTYRKLP